MTKEMRSKIMRSIKSSDTRPELAVRKLLTEMGYRYRLHRKELPGKPDIAFIGRKKAIFVHGCFWHGHEGCPIAHTPNIEFWKNKLKTNKQRDQRVLKALSKLKWKVIVVWECNLETPRALKSKLRRFLGNVRR
jgi:DNA mismatch endonuclease (patch repair protein)